MKATAVIKKVGGVSGTVGSAPSVSASLTKLGGASVIVDPSLDPTSTNPVENKAITEAIETINGNVSSLGNALDTLSGVVDGKYDASNPNGYISGISGNDVKTALGYTPYNATNPNGYVNATQAANAAPVQSVNGQTGAVSLDANDVGALPDTTVIPSKTSDLTNDSGFVNASGAASAAPVQSVNGQTGTVSLSIPTVPSNVSAFTNDAEYVTASTAPVRSVNGQTGVVTLSIPTVPSNVSAFTNDAGYLTLSTLPIYSGGVS